MHKESKMSLTCHKKLPKISKTKNILNFPRFSLFRQDIFQTSYSPSLSVSFSVNELVTEWRTSKFIKKFRFFTKNGFKRIQLNRLSNAPKMTENLRKRNIFNFPRFIWLYEILSSYPTLLLWWFPIPWVTEWVSEGQTSL